MEYNNNNSNVNTTANGKQGYKIDWEKNTFTMTKAFAQQSAIVDTPEYYLRNRMRVEQPELRMIMKTIKNTPRKTQINYNKMRAYILCLRDQDEWLMKFDAVQKASKAHNNPYNYVRDWFFKSFPDYTAIAALDSDGYLDHRTVYIMIENPIEQEEAWA